jgi:hypothetical protein
VVAQPAGAAAHPFLSRRLADSAELRDRVEAAAGLGLSLKRFDGWEPTETTTYRYDDTGRLVSSTTTRDVEWDPEQQAWMLGLAHYRSLIHGPCGGYLPDTVGVDAADRFEAEDPMRCELCTARAERVKVHTSGDHAPFPEALLWPTHRRRRNKP